jgi:hypothetical protein
MSYDHFFDSLDLNSRAKRRRAVNLAISLLTRVRQAEDDNLGRFPENFQQSDAYSNAEFSLDYLIDAIENLSVAY